MIQLGNLTDFTSSELVVLNDACALVNDALSNSKFQQILLKASYDSTPDANNLILLKLTQPITIMRLCCENLGWWATHVSKTIAFENDNGVTFNRPNFDNESLAAKANTLFHEACHVAGYHHVSARDYLSVPYQAGDLLEDYLNASPVSASPLSSS